MKINIWPFSFSVGVVTALVFAICAFFVAVAPDATGAVFSYLLHIDLTGLVRPISWGGFVAGLVTVGVGTALCASVVAWLYNRMA
jgi:hypothetical protein